MPHLCSALAKKLLWSHVGGGEAFIFDKRINGAAINWQEMAHNILREWCTGGNANIRNLLWVLTEIEAVTAAQALKLHVHAQAK